MTTVRQIQRTWDRGEYLRLFSHLAEARIEGALPATWWSSPRVAAAALALIRLDELNQGGVPLAAVLVRVLLAAQASDGSWGDTPLTALCLRALLCSNGDGAAIARGIEHLKAMQRSDGLWPKVAIRRMAGDPLASACVLLQLAEHGQFNEAVNVTGAVDWFRQHASVMEEDTRRLWEHVRVRCRPARVAALAWS